MQPMWHVKVWLLIGAMSLLGYYLHYLPYLPINHDYSKIDFPELDRHTPIEVLDSATGLVAKEGWARFPNKMIYNPSMSKSYVPIFKRHKFWNYFYIISEGHLTTMAHTDIGLIKAAYINIRDIKHYENDIVEAKVEDFFGKHVSISPNVNGFSIDSSVSHSDLNMTFFARSGTDYKANINIQAKTTNGTLDGSMVADFLNSEGITGAHSAPGDKYKHFFGTKVPLIRFTGELKLNGKAIVTCKNESPCLGLFDGGRSVSPYF